MVDNQGGVDISYQTEECNTSLSHGIFMRRSTNGGASFGPALKINKPGQWKDNPDPADLLPPKNARLPASTSAPLVFNPVDHSLNYIVQNNVNRATSGADISFTRSLDYGQHVVEHDHGERQRQRRPGARDQFFPWMDVDPEGDLHAIWFDNRNDPGNLLIKTFQGDSSDGGATWANRNISTQSWNPNLSFFGSGAFIGDYNGIAAGEGRHLPDLDRWPKQPGPAERRHRHLDEHGSGPIGPSGRRRDDEASRGFDHTDRRRARPALAAPPALAHRAKLKGKVVDTTCYGPCIVHADPPLYTGEVRIVIRRVADGKRIRAVTPDAGRFGLRLRPARYELTPKFEDDSCREGAAVTTRVRRSQVNRVEIDVHNRCILAL